MKKTVCVSLIAFSLLLLGCKEQIPVKTLKNIESTDSVLEENIDTASIADKPVANVEKDTSKDASKATTTANTTKSFSITAKKWSFSPSTITVNKGDTVKLSIKSSDVTHGFFLSAFNVSETLTAGKTTNVSFLASKSGTFSFTCSVYCGSGHSDMVGTLIVK